MRKFPPLLLAMFALSCGAQAADNAERGFTLFSGNGRYFAFEEFGVEDGSGFPYDDIFVIDLERNAWAEGTPFRERVEDEDTSLGTVRASAWAKGSPLLQSLKITEPGEVLASRPPTEQSADAHSVTFSPFFPSQGWDEERHRVPGDGRYTLMLDQVAFPLAEACFGEDKRQWGFALTIRDNETGASAEAHRDKAIPSSRLCPLGYDIADVLVYRMQGEMERHVAPIGMYTPGFEGANRRLIAVPFVLP